MVGSIPGSFTSRDKKRFPIRKKAYIKKMVDSLLITKNRDGSVDIDGSLMLSGLHLKSFAELGVGKIRKVSGFVYCYENLTSLIKDSPEYVGGDFTCPNGLKSLEGAPKFVGGNFRASHSHVKTLEGAPRHVGGDFYCSCNQLVSFKGAPDYVALTFWCQYAKADYKELTTAVGGSIYT